MCEGLDACGGSSTGAEGGWVAGFTLALLASTRKSPGSANIEFRTLSLGRASGGRLLRAIAIVWLRRSASREFSTLENLSRDTGVSVWEGSWEIQLRILLRVSSVGSMKRTPASFCDSAIQTISPFVCIHSLESGS